MSNLPNLKRQCVDVNVSGPESPLHPPPCVDPVEFFLKMMGSGNDSMCAHCAVQCKSSDDDDDLCRLNAGGCGANKEIEFPQMLWSEFGTELSILCSGLIPHKVLASFVLGMLWLHKNKPKLNILDMDGEGAGVQQGNMLVIVNNAAHNNVLEKALRAYMPVSKPDIFTRFTCEELLELIALIEDIPQLVEFLLEKHNNTLMVLYLFRSYCGPDADSMEQVYAGESACRKVYELQKALHEKQKTQLPLEEQPIQ